MCSGLGVVEVSVERDVFFPLCGGVIFFEDRFNGTLGLASSTVNADIGIDVQHDIFKASGLAVGLEILDLIDFDGTTDTVDRTYLNAGCITCTFARFSNDEWHNRTLSIDVEVQLVTA